MQFWSLPAHVAPDRAEVAEEMPGLAALERVQVELVGRRKLHPRLVALLRDRVFADRPELELRLFESGSDAVLDLAFLRELPMLRRLSIEIGGSLANLEALAALRQLRSLALAVPKGSAPDLLAHVPATVEAITLWPHDGASRLDLHPLERFTRLTSLDLTSYDGDLGAILPRLSRLRRLALRRIKGLRDATALSGLAQLRSLIVHGGGIVRLDAIDALALRYLELWGLAKLADVSVVSRLRVLEGLVLASLPRVAAFPDARRLRALRIVKLANMRALRDFSALRRAPALEELVYQKADHQRPADFVPVLENPHLRRGGFGFYKRADVAAMTALLAEHDIDGEVYMYPQVRGTLTA